MRRQFFRTIDRKSRKTRASIKQPVTAQLKKLEASSHLCLPLDNLRGFDLTGYYKLYAARKSIRMVYRIVEDKVIVEIVGIGRRENFEVYAGVARRLLKRK